jgi:hypothetical protein
VNDALTRLADTLRDVRRAHQIPSQNGTADGIMQN